ncbi:MAG: O-antigen ligase family protein [Pseudomonadota bacterium]|nr:O-antigen ligase family protein [Pseudomonadota bacterium]
MLWIGALTLAAALIMAKAPTFLAVTIIISLIIGALTFINTEFALYILIAAMLLGPQFGMEGAAGEGVRSRGVTLRVDDFLLVIIGLSWFLKTAVQKEIGLFLRTPLNKPIAYYFLACLFATLFGYMMGRVKGTAGMFFLVKYFEYYVVYFMAVNHLKDEAQIRRFTYFMLIVCFLVCLFAFSQIPQGHRPSAPFEGPQGEPNTLGGYLVLMLSITFGLLLTLKNRKPKKYLWTLVFFIVIALAATLSRSSWVSLLPMGLALLYYSEKRKTILTVMLFLVIAGPMILPPTVRERALYTFTQAKEEGQIQVGGTRIDTSTSARLLSWKVILTRDFIQQPLLGYGVTGYPFVDAQYPRVLAETGLIGLVFFIMLLYTIYRNAYLTFRQTKNDFFRGLSLGYLAGFFAMLAHGIGANTFIIVRIMEPFWFLTAMIIMIPVVESSPASIAADDGRIGNQPLAIKHRSG